MDEAFRSFETAINAYDCRPSRVDSFDALLYHDLRRDAERVVMPNLPACLRVKTNPMTKTSEWR